MEKPKLNITYYTTKGLWHGIDQYLWNRDTKYLWHFSAGANDTSQSLYDATKNLLQNETGVNLDEESVKLTQLQNQYNSSALMIQTIQSMFTALLNAVGG